MATNKTATNDSTNKLWKINMELGTASSNLSQTIQLSTKDTYIDKDISITATATKPSAATVAASTTGVAATSTGISGITKSGSNYNFTVGLTATGTSKADTTASGYATAGTTKDSQDFESSLSVSESLPAAAATVTFGATAASPTVAIDAANDNVLASTATTSKPSSGYYAAVKATAPKTTLSATTKSVDTAGYLGAASEITASAATIAKTGSTYYVPITAGSIGVNASSAPTGYTENTTAIVPTSGSLTLEEGYYPKTFIKLSTLVPNEATITNNATGAATIRTGTTVYDKDGNLITGTMGNATVVGGTLSHEIGTPSYNSTSGKFDMSCTVTAGAPTVSAAGYISSTEGTKTASSTLTENHELAKIALSTSKTSGNLTVAPTLARTAKPSGDTWVDAASGAATTTKPTAADPYVQIDAAAATNTLKIKPTVSTAGYGDTTNYGYTEWSGTVGSAAATTRYIPITKSVSSASSGSATATGTGVALGTKTTTQPSSGKYITVTGSGKLNVTTAGWISSGEKTGGSQTAYYTINASTQTNSCTATASKVNAKATYSTSVTGATGYDVTGITTTAPTSGDYITITPTISTTNGTAKADATASCSVTAGYADAATKTATATQNTTAVGVDTTKGDTQYIKLYAGAYQVI